jgi:hypothetical protein
VTEPSDISELRAAVADLHRRIDAWHAAVEGVAAEAPESSDALADPRLEDAQDRFYEALSSFEEASLPVLGMEPVDVPPEDTEEAVAADDFFLHFVVGLTGDEDPERFDEAMAIVDQCGFVVLERLEAAGFHVPRFGVSRGDPTAFLDLGEDGDDGEEAP